MKGKDSGRDAKISSPACTGKIILNLDYIISNMAPCIPAQYVLRMCIIIVLCKLVIT